MIKIRNKILFALIMFFVILIFNSIDVEAAGKYDYLILGDSLTSQMYAAYTGSWNQFVQQSKTINGKEVMFLGAGGYGYDYWFNNHYQDIQKALKNAKDGATCVIYLGGNDTGNGSKYATAISKMAAEFPKVNFYFCSYPPSTGRTSYNKEVDNLNKAVLNGIKSSARYNKNLFYKEINNKVISIGNTKKSLYHFIMDNSNYMQDPDHFGIDLYKAVWEQIMSKLTKGSDSSGSSSMIDNNRRLYNCWGFKNIRNI